MGRPTRCHVHCHGIVKSLFAPEIVRNRDKVGLSRLGDIPRAGTVETARREDLNSHLEEALPRGFATLTGRPGFGWILVPSVHGAPTPHAAVYRIGVEPYQSGDL